MKQAATLTLHIEQTRKPDVNIDLAPESLDALLALLQGHADADIAACAERLLDGSVNSVWVGDVFIGLFATEEDRKKSQ